MRFLKYVEDQDGNELEINDLTEEERLQIMYNIRLSAKKYDQIQLNSECPECEEENTHSFIESNVKLKPLKNTTLTFNLSLNGYKIKINDVKRGFDIFATEYVEKQNITSEVEKQFIRLAGYIDKIYVLKEEEEIEVKLSFSEKLEIFNLLPESEITDINEQIQLMDYGLKYTIKDFSCPHCSKKIKEYQVPLFNFFLS